MVDATSTAARKRGRVMKFLEDGTYIIRFGKLYRVEFPKSFLDECQKVEIPNWKAIPVTNAQKIRSMTDEELAELWWEHVDCGECPVHSECKMIGQDCIRLALDWLKEEATDG